jgi:hypothetical protein
MMHNLLDFTLNYMSVVVVVVVVVPVVDGGEVISSLLWHPSTPHNGVKGSNKKH